MASLGLARAVLDMGLRELVRSGNLIPPPACLLLSSPLEAVLARHSNGISFGSLTNRRRWHAPVNQGGTSQRLRSWKEACSCVSVFLKLAGRIKQHNEH